MELVRYFLLLLKYCLSLAAAAAAADASFLGSKLFFLESKVIFFNGLCFLVLSPVSLEKVE